MSNKILTLAGLCEEQRLPVQCVRDVIDIFAEREKAELMVHEAKMRMAGRRRNNTALPLTDEDGYAWGEVEARIPKVLFYNLLQRKSFGYEGLVHDDGIKELRKDPRCRVDTVSGKTMVGARGERARAGLVAVSLGGRRTIKHY